MVSNGSTVPASDKSKNVCLFMKLSIAKII